jgi:hypothetical protein
VAIAPFALIAACQLVFPTFVEVRSTDASVPKDATMAIALDSASDRAPARDTTPPPPPSSGCAGAQPPPPPTTDSNPTSVPPFVLAVRTMQLQNPDAGVPLGYNLDDDCTCEDAGPPSCVSSIRHCDAPGGRDQAGNSILTIVNSFAFGEEPADYVNMLIGRGSYTMLFVISDYNGGSDDTQVTMAVLVGSGLYDPDGGTVAPRWDGADRWNVDPSSFLSATEVDGGYQYVPLGSTGTAYVTGGVLVAQVTKATFDVGVGTFVFSTAVMSGTIVPTAGSFAIEGGQIAGRLPLSGVFTLLSTVSDPFDPSMNLCGPDPTLAQILGAVCGSADIMSDPLDDNHGLGCDAISMGLGFTAYPAQLGVPFRVFRPNDGCDASPPSCESD